MGCNIAVWRCVLCCNEYQVALEHWRLKGARAVRSTDWRALYYLEGSPETHDELF